MTLFEEMIAAARGMVALVRGRRDAPSYFDLTLRGLAGSLAVFLFAAAVNAYLPFMTGKAIEGIAAWQGLLLVAVLYVLQIGFTALVLNQIGRLDGLLPYLVADNWATFFITALTIAFEFTGFGGGGLLVLIAILVIIVEINICRLIVTLRPMQIALVLIAQLVGVTIGLFIVGMFLPETVMTGPPA